MCRPADGVGDVDEHFLAAVRGDERDGERGSRVLRDGDGLCCNGEVARPRGAGIGGDVERNRPVAVWTALSRDGNPRVLTRRAPRGARIRKRDGDLTWPAGAGEIEGAWCDGDASDHEGIPPTVGIASHQVRGAAAKSKESTIGADRKLVCVVL